MRPYLLNLILFLIVFLLNLILAISRGEGKYFLIAVVWLIGAMRQFDLYKKQ